MKKISLLLILISTLLLFYSCEKAESEAEYKYEVTGTSGNYSVTIENSDEDTQQWSSVGNGWWYKWTQTGERWLYVSAQNNNSTGNVTVKIIRDGKVLKENTSYGGYSIATASGTY